MGFFFFSPYFLKADLVPLYQQKEKDVYRQQLKNRAEPGDLMTTRETTLPEETYFCKGNGKRF